MLLRTYVIYIKMFYAILCGNITITLRQDDASKTRNGSETRDVEKIKQTKKSVINIISFHVFKRGTFSHYKTLNSRSFTLFSKHLRPIGYGPWLEGCHQSWAMAFGSPAAQPVPHLLSAKLEGDSCHLIRCGHIILMAAAYPSMHRCFAVGHCKILYILLLKDIYAMHIYLYFKQYIKLYNFIK